ncbi:SusC/RagA family TonB-linked outer membrane protein [Arcticibacter tournemirensis]
MKKWLLLVSLGLFFLPDLTAQQRRVTGKVTAAEDGTPLPGVSVKVKGSNAGTSTAADGSYSINVNQGQVLVFSFVGATTLERAVGTSNVMNVALRSDARALNEVVVTALGVRQDRRSLGYAVQEISSSDIAASNQANPLNALKGRATGVQITSGGGAAGAGSRIQIRGVNSLNPSANNQPLFVIDGIPISNNTDQFGIDPNTRAGGDVFQNTNRAADINPEDIETISILRGPAASVLYGLRAANGAIVITTKSGKAGVTSCNYKVSYSFDDVATVPPIQTTFGNGNNNAFVSSVNTWGPKIDPSLPVYNPYDLFFKTGNQLQNSFTFSGGNEKATYFTSISNLDQAGVVPNSSYGRTSIRIAGTLKASDKFKFDGSANYINSGGSNPRTGVNSGAINYLMRHTNTADPSDYLMADGSQKVYNSGIDNPFYFAENAYLKDNVNRILGNIGVDFTANKWLSFNYKAGIDHYTDFRSAYIEQGLIVNRQGAMTEQRVSYNEINSNFIAKAVKDFNEKWTGTFLLGHSFTNIKQTNVSMNGTQAIAPNFESINNYSVYTTTTYPGEKNIIGVFADAKIGYDNTLYLDLTARNDWSSTLPKSNRSFFYPSASLSYVFSETLGLSDNPVMNFGKLRFSYAEVGKDADPYQIGMYYSTLQAFDGIGGVRREVRVGSENLRPERTKGLEMGGEFKFLRDRVSLDANYAITNSIDQIVPVPISFGSGFDVYVTNAGKIRNRSLELQVNASLINKRDLRWSVNANWARTKGRVLAMPEGVKEIIFNPESPWVKQIIKEGGRPGDWYGWPLLRVNSPGDPNDGQLIIGANGLPSITSVLADNYLVGNAYPDWTGGVGSSLIYKGIALSFLFNFRKGGDVFDISRRQRYETGIGAETELRNASVIFKGVKNTGTADNPVYVRNDIPATIDQTFYNASFNYRLASENNGLQDGSWVRLQNVSLSYNLPKSVLGKTFIKSASLSVTANNLWVSTPFVGFDPEGSTYGAGSNAVGYVGTGVPTTRSFFMGLNVNF